MSVKRSFISGVFFMGLARYSNIVIQLIITAILARLLTPGDFGAVAISTVLITFFQLLSNIGFSPAIIQRHDLDESDLNGVFTCCVIIGLCTALVIFFLAIPIANYYNIEVLGNIFKLLSICSFFTCLNIVPESLLKREKRFKYISTRTIVINVFCGCLAVIAAYFGLGIYSLLIMPILSAIMVFVVNYMQVPLQIVSLHTTKLGVLKVLNYSMYQFFYNFLYYISRNLDKLVLGKVMGSVPLGYYEKSYHLMMTPVANLSNVVAPTIQPFFADKQDDKEWMFRNCRKILHFLALLSFPLSVFCYFSAHEIILLVFGDQWEPAVDPFRILSISIGFQVIYSPQGAFFQAANSTRKLFTSGLVVALVNIIAIVVGVNIFKSVNLLCYGIVVSFVVSFFYCYYVLVVELYKRSYWLFLKEFIRPLIISLGMVVGFVLLDSINLSVGNLLLSLTVKILISILIYGLSLIVLQEYKFLKIK